MNLGLTPAIITVPNPRRGFYALPVSSSGSWYALGLLLTLYSALHPPPVGTHPIPLDHTTRLFRERVVQIPRCCCLSSCYRSTHLLFFLPYCPGARTFANLAYTLPSCSWCHNRGRVRLLRYRQKGVQPLDRSFCGVRILIRVDWCSCRIPNGRSVWKWNLCKDTEENFDACNARR